MLLNDNFFSISQNFLAPESIHKLSSSIETPANRTKDCLKSILPTFLTGLVTRGSTPEGVSRLFDMVKTHDFKTASEDEGHYVVKNIFGDDLKRIVSIVESKTGMSGEKINKLLNLIAPVYMNVISLKVKNDHFNTTDLTHYLFQQKTSLAAFDDDISNLARVDRKKAPARRKDVSNSLPWKKIVIAIILLIGVLIWWLASHELLIDSRFTTRTSWTNGFRLFVHRIA